MQTYPPSFPVGGSIGQVLANVGPGQAAWKTLSIQGNLTEYFQDTGSAVSNYKKLLTGPYANKTTEAKTNLAVGAGQVLFNFISEPGAPGLTFLPAGSFEFHVHASRTVGNRTAVIYAEIWEADASGADIQLIGTSEKSIALTGSEVEYRLYFVTANVYTFQSSASRIVCRIKTDITGGSTNDTVNVYLGAEADSHIAVPLSVTPE